MAYRLIAFVFLAVALFYWKLLRAVINLCRLTTVQSLQLQDPDPLVAFDLINATTRDYVRVNSTLRYPYHQTMAHQTMHVNHWIEIDKHYLTNLEMKKKVVEQQGSKVLDCMPENINACGELLQLLVDYLPKKYPTLFIKSFSISRGLSIHNKTTIETFSKLEQINGKEALRVISRLVQDDFLMARVRSDGAIYLVGGLVAFPGSYLLSEKIGRPISSIHEPVPQFNESLLKSVNRKLKKFGPSEPFERTSWSIMDDDNLFYHNIALLPANAQLPHTFPPGDLRLRLDHQTFLKLPRTKGIVFGVHPVLIPLKDLEDDPLIPELLAKIHSESGKDLLQYKMTSRYEDILMPYLQQQLATRNTASQ